eukprot:Unigene5737_Nuclearia_a/m.17525 Unigene5737_Nuclearia_a/g.17525  ORF Unigene5737_Nuclearia_a/g.17525 Unigene5737_Nuclearia_a/m.17525 type:complete len:691 (+) Unigene5737_Nuclearia_a:364-2436(+)
MAAPSPNDVLLRRRLTVVTTYSRRQRMRLSLAYAAGRDPDARPAASPQQPPREPDEKDNDDYDDNGDDDDVDDALDRLPSMSLLLLDSRRGSAVSTGSGPRGSRQHAPSRPSRTLAVPIDAFEALDSGPAGELGMDSVGSALAGLVESVGSTHHAARSRSRRASVVSIQRQRPQVARRFSAPLGTHDLRWQLYLSQLQSLIETPRKSPLMQMLIRAGVPHNLRAQVWPVLCGSKFLRAANEGAYRKILADNAATETVFTRQIETDLHRTFPDRLEYNTVLLGPNPRSLQRLRRVLYAYSFRNPTTGYCQGMNFVAAFLLNIFDDEEDVFWMFATVIERILPNNYYDSQLKGIKAEADLFEMIIAKELPRLNRHLTDNGIDMAMFTLEWFVSLFTMSFRSKMSLRIWDLFLYEGRISLFCVALSLVRLHEEKLLQFSTMDRLYDALKSLPAFNYNPDTIMQSVKVTYMAAMVKRLSFSIIQSQSLAEAITSSRQQLPFVIGGGSGGNRRSDSNSTSRKSPGASPAISRVPSNASSYRSLRSSNSVAGSLSQMSGESDTDSLADRKSASAPSTSPASSVTASVASSAGSFWGLFGRWGAASSAGQAAAGGSPPSPPSPAPPPPTVNTSLITSPSVLSAPASPAAALVASEANIRARSSSGQSGGSAGGFRRAPNLGNDDERKDRRRTTKFLS